MRLEEEPTPAQDDALEEAPLERCAFCGQRCSPDQFEDGLRCKLCAEAMDGA